MLKILRLKAQYVQKFMAYPLPEVKPKSLNFEFSKSIADAFDAMPHTPQDDEVLRAYSQLGHELNMQFCFLRAAGLKCLVYEGTGEPYKNSKEMFRDVFENNSLTIFATENGFGMGTPQSIAAMENNPLLAPTMYDSDNGHPLCVNDLLRFVHDIFGHCTHECQFGQLGEEIAWWTHLTTLTPLAAKALTTETRGQNSWVNFGKHLRNADGNIPQSIREFGYVHPKDRPYADQKIGLLPDWCMELKHNY